MRNLSSRAANTISAILSVAIFSVTIVLFLIFLAACGGGTSGTGGTGSDRILGKLLTAQGEPLANVNVTVQETGDGAITDALGEFQIETMLVSETATLLLEDQSLNTSVQIGDIKESAEIALEILINREENSAEIVDLQITSNVTDSLSSESGAGSSSSTEQSSQTSSSSAGPNDGTSVASSVNSCSSSSGSSSSASVNDTEAFAMVITGELESERIDVSGARIGIVDTNDSTRVGADGQFSLNTRIRDGRATIAVELERGSAHVTLPRFPLRALSVRTRLRIEPRPNQESDDDTTELELSVLSLSMDPL